MDWDKFVQEFSGLVVWSARQRLYRSGYSYNDADIEDIHQEVFLSLYNGKLKQLKDKSKLSGWLAIITGGIAISYMRQKGLVAQKSVSLFDEGPGLNIADSLQDNSPLAREQTDKELQEKLLNEIIESLEPKEKIILNLYFIYENSIKEIAENLDMPQGTIASIISRTRDELKDRLKEK